ncbi:hypothetical protein C0585_03375 [Candidatus Woesearchaeota archaeon]|nr:MAG: hypothetical protein C0585_03375 [Candidatus Woesearchaeota archaeon]
MKKAIITGASSGLGLEIGNLLKNDSFEVINISRKDSPFNDIKCDLSLDTMIGDVIEKIKKEHDKFDVIILNSGIMPLAKIGQTNFDIDNLFKINVTGAIKIIDGLLDLIKKNGADIIIVGSTAAKQGYDEHGIYCATKHALDGYIKSLQAELKEEKVRVIGFHPGGFNSNLRGGIVKEGYMDPRELAKLIIQLINLPKVMEVSDIVITRKKNY